MKVRTIVAATVLFLSAAPAALAQSAYTSGTIAGSEAAGYPSVRGLGSGLYAYAPDHQSSVGTYTHQRRHPN
jgi:hypothetical protein